MSAVHGTAVIAAGARIGAGVEIGPYCVVGREVAIGDGARLVSHVVVDGCTTIGSGCTLFPFACVGTQTQDLKFRGARTFVEIGERTTLREYVTVNSGTNEGEVTRVGRGCHIMAYSHVAHGCALGEGVIMSNGSQLAGHITVEDGAVLGGLTAAHQFVRIGKYCMIGGMSRLTQDCPPFMIVSGIPPEVHGPNREGLKRHGVSDEAQQAIKDAYRLLYRSDLSTAQALDRIAAEIPVCPEIEHLVGFIRGSERGIVK